MMGEDEEVIIAIMEKCLAEGKPYRARYRKDALY